MCIRDSRSSAAHTIQAMNGLLILDYMLASRKDIDTSRIGTNGGSGGGTHTVLLDVYKRQQIHLPSGAVKRNSGQYPKDYLRGSGLELLPDKMLIYRKGVSSTVES